MTDDGDLMEFLAAELEKVFVRAEVLAERPEQIDEKLDRLAELLARWQ